MKKILFFIIMISSLYSENILKLGMGTGVYPNFEKVDTNLAIKTLARITIKSWVILKDYTDYDIIEYQNTSSLIKDFIDGKLDVIIISTRNYSNHDDKLKDSFSLRTTIQHHRNLDVTMGLIVQASKKNKKISYWRGKRLSVPNSFLITDLSRLYFLEHFKTKRDNFFSKITTTTSEGESILNTFFKKSDVTIASEESFRDSGEFNPQITKRLAFIPIYKFKDFPFLILFNKSIIKDKEYALESIKTSDFFSKKGTQVRKILQTYGEFMSPEEKDVKKLVNLYKKLRQLDK